jgi:nicotinic acid phosphoribosyltransferase
MVRSAGGPRKCRVSRFGERAAPGRKAVDLGVASAAVGTFVGIGEVLLERWRAWLDGRRVGRPAGST